MASDILDPTLVACDNLSEALASVNDEDERGKLVIEHIKWCSAKSGKIDGFKNGLEWFNVAKPLELNRDLKGKVVVLDFFTYCCINCMHIFPHLKLLEEEFSIQNGVVVVGVHSAKFDNEKDSANISSALQRYSISHPVVNDAEGSMWSTLGISCWPTLLILGPHGEPIFIAMGEGHMDLVFLMVRTAVAYYGQQGQLSKHALPIAPSTHLLPQAVSTLLFPGKVTSHFRSNEGTSHWVAVSDTGHHRILLQADTNKVEHVVGGVEPGFTDGSFSEARFNSPQGIAFGSNDVLFVADTDNHAIREINLKTLCVSTLAGNGTQGKDLAGGGTGVNQPLSSPWDLCMVEYPGSNAQVLLIAMAGSHQIWALFLEGGTWWKGKKYPVGACVAIAGTGKEENRNNSYPHAAAFAQPSGLSLAKDLQAMFIADSESSSIRKLSLTDGKVSAVIGGERSPFNLFGFGDVDGKQYEAKLQHPLGVAWSSKERLLYVADSYNHKVKAVDVSTNTSRTVLGSGQAGDSCSAGAEQLNEPGGLCVSADGTLLLVADTNNHCIKMLNLLNGQVAQMEVCLPAEHKAPQPGAGSRLEASLSPAGGTLSLTVCCSLSNQLALTPAAPQRWKLQLPDDKWTAQPSGGDFTPRLELQLTVPSGQPNSTVSALLTHRLYVCHGGTQCSVKNLQLKVAIRYDSKAPTTASHTFQHLVT